MMGSCGVTARVQTELQEFRELHTLPNGVFDNTANNGSKDSLRGSKIGNLCTNALVWI